MIMRTLTSSNADTDVCVGTLFLSILLNSDSSKPGRKKRRVENKSRKNNSTCYDADFITANTGIDDR